MPMQTKDGKSANKGRVLEEMERSCVAGMMLLALDTSASNEQRLDFAVALARAVMAGTITAAFDAAASVARKAGKNAAPHFAHTANIAGAHYNEQKDRTLIMAETFFNKKEETK